MGYYTYFTITIADDPDNQEDNLLEDIRTMRNTSIIELDYAFEDTWRSHIEDMTNLSKKYPKMCIALYGECEDSNDRWVAYFKDGKSEVLEATINYPEFDITTFKRI